MLDSYKDFISKNINLENTDKVLLGVSGGIDSMVMLDLSISAGIVCGVAHINHHMRGEESDMEADFVRRYCEDKNIPFYLYDINPKTISKGNFQEEARKIRYNWWKDLCDVHNYKYIFTGHHRSDGVETFIINLMRGSGLNGLAGIPIQSNAIFRPISIFSKEDIVQYAANNAIPFKEDSSNAENKYLRNKIRNQLLPEFIKLKVNAVQGIAHSINHLAEDKELLSQLVTDVMASMVSYNPKRYLKIDTTLLESKANATSLLYHYLRNKGFSRDNTDKALEANIGSVFISDHYEMLVDRGALLIRKLEKGSKRFNENLIIKGEGEFDLDIYTLKVDEYDNGGLLLNNIEYPLIVRRWQSGDRMKPNGLAGKSQKVKDMLTNMKVNRWDKHHIFVLLKEDRIISLHDMRPSVLHKDQVNGKDIYIKFELS